MSKYYRVKKTNFMWDEGAILKYEESFGPDGGYVAVEDVWERVELGNEYISARIIEAHGNADFFERVYPLNGMKKAMFGTKLQAQAAAAALYEGNKANEE